MSTPDRLVTLKSAYVEARPGMVTRRAVWDSKRLQSRVEWALITEVLQHDVSCTVTLRFADGDSFRTHPGDSLTIMHPVAADEWLAAQSDVS